MLEIRVRKSLLMAEGQTDLAVDFQIGKPAVSARFTVNQARAKQRC